MIIDSVLRNLLVDILSIINVNLNLNFKQSTQILLSGCTTARKYFCKLS